MASNTGKHRTRRICLLAAPESQILDIAGPPEVFAKANRFVQEQSNGARPPYDIQLLARIEPAAPRPECLAAAAQHVAGHSVDAFDRNPDDAIRRAVGRFQHADDGVLLPLALALVGDQAVVRLERRADVQARRPRDETADTASRVPSVKKLPPVCA